MNYLAAAIVGHLVGDYLLQNDRMAQNKKSNTWWCLVHVALYTFGVSLCTGWLSHWVLLSVFVPHFCIDRWMNVKRYMQKIGQASFAEPPFTPWSMIIVDNTVHLVCLLITCRMIDCGWL